MEAILAYSDGSDFSSDEYEEQSESNKKNVKLTQKDKKSALSDVETVISGKINKIYDKEPKHFNPSSCEDEISDENGELSSEKTPNLLKTIPKAKNLVRRNDLDKDDILDDVPTTKNWSVLKSVETKQSSSINSNDLTYSKIKASKKKLKLILPALSVFDDEDDFDTDEPLKKTFKSGSGTGIFASLPKPKNSITSLVPTRVKKIEKSLFNVKTQALNSEPEDIKIASVSKSNSKKDEKLITISDDEEEESGNDFFSLAADKEDNITLSVTHISQSIKTPDFGTITNKSLEFKSNEMLPIIPKYIATEQHTAEQLPFHQNNTQPYTEKIGFSARFNDNKIGLNSEELRKLSGKKGESIINLIDVNADDALMNKDEWLARSLCEQKPQFSYSKKKEGVPSQGQKRKHQITYLAHQAKEREQELQNSWGQNKLTKIQSRQKYGF